LRTSIAGKLNNTTLPAPRPLAPLYEAVHNSLQAIEDAGAGHHVIEIVIGALPRDARRRHCSPGHIQNPRYRRRIHRRQHPFVFTAESRYKADEGAKGNGRFLWLKAFAKVEIDSSFEHDGQIFRRSFVFDRSEDQDIPPTPNIEKGAVDAGGQLTPDGRDCFAWNSQLKLYFEIISFEKPVGDALRRNRMLFKRLGLPTDRPDDD
jgi:hypothetical protein